MRLQLRTHLSLELNVPKLWCPKLLNFHDNLYFRFYEQRTESKHQNITKTKQNFAKRINSSLDLCKQKITYFATICISASTGTNIAVKHKNPRHERDVTVSHTCL